ncbi:MAG TPA: hypothetical protein VJ672_04015 [Gemmatimonadaceae bacterium]|nr:hypothetical protein [Gemmatimonadaceae bacterium]
MIASMLLAFEAQAQSTTMVETLPHADSTVRRSPFDMSPPDMQAAARLIGCYAVNLEPWSSLQATGDSIPVPSRLELLSERHTRIYIGFGLVARTPGFESAKQKSPPAWSPIGGDSLQIRAWADGVSSLMLFLRRQADGELRGTARYFHDARLEDSTGRWMWERYPNAPASLRAIECGAMQ